MYTKWYLLVPVYMCIFLEIYYVKLKPTQYSWDPFEFKAGYM